MAEEDAQAGIGERTTNMIDELRREVRASASGGGTDLMTLGARFANSLLSERGLAALLLVGLLWFLFTKGDESIQSMDKRIADLEKKVSAMVFQNQSVIERVDEQFDEINQREQEERMRAIQQRYGPFNPTKQGREQ